jgi:hypothetical protein
MTFRMPETGVQISHAHNAAICTEIGDALRSYLRLDPVPMQPRLLALIRQLRDISSRTHKELDA